MKATSTCPKCKSTDITRIPPFKTTTTSNVIQLTKWGTQYGYFDRYVCLSCGFMESYALVDENSFPKWIEKQREEGSLESDFV